MDNPSPTPETPRPSKWYYGIFPVLISLFFVLGPFGFPLLWKSPRFNLFWKVTLTVIVTALTAYIFIGSWQLYQLVAEQFRSLGILP